MTIKNRAFLRGYLGEKTAGWFSPDARKKRKAVREKRYTDRFNKELNDLVNPTEEYPGYETPSAHTAALIAKGQAEAKRHRESGTKPQQNEWNRENWRTLFQPKAKGTSMYMGGEHKLPAPTQTEIQ